MNNIVAIAAMECADAARRAGGSLEDRLCAAMRAARGHWLATQESDQFNAAMEGCARTCEGDELVRMQAEIRRLQALEAVMSGVPVDMEAAMTRDEGIEPLGAMRLWRECEGTRS